MGENFAAVKIDINRNEEILSDKKKQLRDQAKTNK
jgi:hypothetical protein